MTVEATEEEWDGLQNLDPRVCTFDIEIDDRSDGFPEHGSERILSIAAHDSINQDLVVWVDLDGQPVGEALPDGKPDNIDTLHYYDNEVEMLNSFASWVSETDPDLITGWNCEDFDVPFLIERMNEVGAETSQLSRLGWAGIKSNGDPMIKGRTIYDLLTVYKKNSFTELRSYSLDDVAEEELGEAKIEFSGSYYELYQNNTGKFLEYNAHDTDLTVEINREAGVIDFRDTLRREVGVDFEDSYDNKDFIDMMCRRKLDENGYIGPTRRVPETDSDYEGAFVLKPYNGVTQNVVGIDLASLYPYTMAMLNASPETKVSADFDGPAAKAANGQHFRLDQDGIFKQLVDEAISLKSEYKQKRNNAETEEEHEKWATKYASAKTITNSLYGVTGWELFFLYDKDVAEAVTLTGQEVTKTTRDYIQETGYEVVYGDTDAAYISFPDSWGQEECLDTGQELCVDLNETVYPELASGMGIPEEDCLWDIEVEVHMARFFQAGKKKRYAYLPTWKDGHEVDDPEPSISGFASRRSDSAKLTVETETKVLEAILDGRQNEVGEIIFEAAQEITPNSPVWELIGIPGGMNKKITDNPELGAKETYYAVSCDGENCYPQDAHPRAVYNSNKVLDAQITSGDKPKRVYIEPTHFDELERQADVLAFSSPHEIADRSGRFRVDVERMTATTLINPLSEVTEAIGIDVNAAIHGLEQMSLGAF